MSEMTKHSIRRALIEVAPIEEKIEVYKAFDVDANLAAQREELSNLAADILTLCTSVHTEDGVFCMGNGTMYDTAKGPNYSTLQAELEVCRAKVTRYEARLGLDYAYEGLDMVRFELPEEQKKTFPDSVTCLEAAVSLRDDAIDELKAELEQVRRQLAITTTDLDNAKYRLQVISDTEGEENDTLTQQLAALDQVLADHREAWKEKIETMEQQLDAHKERVKELEEALDIDTLVNRFLAWPLPDSVCSDLCATKQGSPHRSGTTLLSAAEAKMMMSYLLQQAIAKGGV